MFGLILGLKAWSHMVYIVISFALLGYGIGATAYLIFKNKLNEMESHRMTAILLSCLAFSLLVSTYKISTEEIEMSMLNGTLGAVVLAAVCALVALPFASAGFLMAFLFSSNSIRSPKLYFWDLTGAACGAMLFYPLLSISDPFHSIIWMAIGSLLIAIWFLESDQSKTSSACNILLAMTALIMGFVGCVMDEPDYKVDNSFGSEWIPGHYGSGSYTTIKRTWNPLGRTDLYDHSSTNNQEYYGIDSVPLQVNLIPAPKWWHFVTSYRAGTPVYEFSNTGQQRNRSRLILFSRLVEVPYLLLGMNGEDQIRQRQGTPDSDISKDKRVVIIGAGGGRDIFMARSHGATTVLGAEINSTTFREMSRGGAAFEYSGHIYEAPGVMVRNIDGRHFVKTQSSGTSDLVILNGVDTFAALSSGAYAFAESYLYTTEAVVDYLRILKRDGIINFNRWSGPETTRLFIMVFDALQQAGVSRPWENVIVGESEGWSIMLIRKTPFSKSEEKDVLDYFEKHGACPIYTPISKLTDEGTLALEIYAASFREGRQAQFIKDCQHDVSAATDDSPFFYKRHKFRLLPDFEQDHPAGGSSIVLVQFVIVISSVLFIMAFILTPLILFQLDGITKLPIGDILPFVGYFACLGLGFIMIEIVQMQKFVLLLGSPMYSISVTLASLLICSGVGSYYSPKIRQLFKQDNRCIAALSMFIVVYLVLYMRIWPQIVEWGIAKSFMFRVLLCASVIAPLGFSLGMFFPTGLVLLGRRRPLCVPWAWGINSGFTVLGSILAIMLAQFLGFKVVLLIASICYLLASLAFWRLDASFCTGRERSTL